MKTINVTFEDENFEELLIAKGENNWMDFILTLLPKKRVKQ